MSGKTLPPGPWHRFSTKFHAGSPFAVVIARGLNRYGDGPEGSVCEVQTFAGVDLDALADLIITAPDMELLLWAMASICHYAHDGLCTFEPEDGPEVTVPMNGHLPDTKHPLWRSARAELAKLRAAEAA